MKNIIRDIIEFLGIGLAAIIGFIMVILLGLFVYACIM
jgi:hypothetical protein